MEPLEALERIWKGYDAFEDLNFGAFTDDDPFPKKGKYYAEFHAVYDAIKEDRKAVDEILYIRDFYICTDHGGKVSALETMSFDIIKKAIEKKKNKAA